MGCRSFPTKEDGIRNPDGTRKYYGRFNQGVVTINLVDVACSSYGDMDKFWTSVLNFVTRLSDADTKDCLEPYQMSLLYCGSTVRWQDSKRRED